MFQRNNTPHSRTTHIRSNKHPPIDTHTLSLSFPHPQTRCLHSLILLSISFLPSSAKSLLDVNPPHPTTININININMIKRVCVANAHRCVPSHSYMTLVYMTYVTLRLGVEPKTKGTTANSNKDKQTAKKTTEKDSKNSKNSNKKGQTTRCKSQAYVASVVYRRWKMELRIANERRFQCPRKKTCC